MMTPEQLRGFIGPAFVIAALSVSVGVLIGGTAAGVIVSNQMGEEAEVCRDRLETCDEQRGELGIKCGHMAKEQELMLDRWKRCEMNLDGWKNKAYQCAQRNIDRHP